MGLIDFILNLAGLLFWLNWRAHGVAQRAHPPSISIATAIKETDPLRGRHGFSLLALLGLLVVRSFFYWQIGSAMHWIPTLPLGAVALPFRSDHLSRMFAYSLLSFGVTLAVFYGWLVLLSLLDQREPAEDGLRKMSRLHLGIAARAPYYLRLALPFLVGTLLWLVLVEPLAWLDILPRPVSLAQRGEQAMLIGASAYLGWKGLIVGVLVLHLLHSYVYLGRSPVWSFVTLTARQLLRPLEKLPLRAGRADLTPLVGVALTFLLFEVLARALAWLALRLPL